MITELNTWRMIFKKNKWLGIKSSPAFVRMSECNGCAERFIRTLKENLHWVRYFKITEELRLAILEFRQIYNETWIMHRHRYKTPSIGLTGVPARPCSPFGRQGSRAAGTARVSARMRIFDQDRQLKRSVIPPREN